MFKKALLSTSNKTGLAALAKRLHLAGCKLISTGGTAEFLRREGLPVTEVAQETGYPEVMDGRVRTLHPRVHMALLGRQGNAEDEALLRTEKLEPYDLVVVNLYPFEEAVKRGGDEADLIENIDIGGPSMLRSASKNFERITVVCDPADYSWLIDRIDAKQALTREERKALAVKVFRSTSAYDDMIARTFADSPSSLRYGENPHQMAQWKRAGEFGLHQAEILHGKALSYNNLLDLDAAAKTVREFDRPAVVAVKHTNPCGVGTADTVTEACRRALRADPVSVFGGIVALNREVDLTSAGELSKIFLECILAPEFTAEALEVLKRKKDLRLLRWPQMTALTGTAGQEIRGILGGLLTQDADQVEVETSKWKFLGTQPSSDIMNDLKFAWRVCAHLKSNAIAIVADGTSLGFGMGQVNRVDAVEHAIGRMRKHHAEAKNPVLASDAFFPFADSIEKIAEAGIKWVIQPGGSIRDNEVFAKAESLGVNLVITGVRHFRH